MYYWKHILFLKLQSILSNNAVIINVHVTILQQNAKSLELSISISNKSFIWPLGPPVKNRYPVTLVI